MIAMPKHEFTELILSQKTKHIPVRAPLKILPDAVGAA